MDDSERQHIREENWPVQSWYHIDGERRYDQEDKPNSEMKKRYGDEAWLFGLAKFCGAGMTGSLVTFTEDEFTKFANKLLAYNRPKESQ